MSTEKPSYYGPFFWVAAISFIVPLVVAFKALQSVPVTTKPASHPDVSGVDHALWDYLLKTYVENGLVDYDGMARDYLFRTYLRQLARAEPEKLATPEDRLALLVNAYNAFVIDGVISHKIRHSVMDYQRDDKGFFDIEEHIFSSRTVSLNTIEHELIRKPFKDPRVHVTLVCAARSCPSIRAEAYEGKRVNQQLDDQSNRFANDREYVAYDTSNNTLRLSPILDWYGGDWDASGGYLSWLEARVKDPALRTAITRARENKVGIAFFTYDWTLNSQASTAKSDGAAPKPNANFGSGSIPNG